MECSQLIVTSQFRVLEFHIGFYVQSSPDAKSSTKYVPGVVSANQTWLHVYAMANDNCLVTCLQNNSTLPDYPSNGLHRGILGCTGRCWFFLRYLGKGGVNRAVLGLWFPWTEAPETSQKNDICLTLLYSHILIFHSRFPSWPNSMQIQQ